MINFNSNSYEKALFLYEFWLPYATFTKTTNMPSSGILWDDCNANLLDKLFSANILKLDVFYIITKVIW